MLARVDRSNFMLAGLAPAVQGADLHAWGVRRHVRKWQHEDDCWPERRSRRYSAWRCRRAV